MSTHDQVQSADIHYESTRERAENPVRILDVTLRDGHQSLFATRGRTEDMLPVAEMLDEIGFWAIETWGGATFDTMHRFLNEDPWERIRVLKKYIKKTPFSMLLRGQNLVGYRNYADDVAEAFVERCAENGIDVFRTFDALNDYRNFATVVPAIKKSRKHFQGCICYSLTEPRLGGEVYNLAYYVGKAKELAALGADTICIKDMAGLLAPYDAYDLIKAIKAEVKLPINLHSHFTSGLASMTQLKAIEAGVDIIDTCMTPYAYRTSHSAVEPLVMTLLGTTRDTGLDIQKLAAISEVLEKEILPKYRHLLDDTKVSLIDINVLLHQIPGGMLSNLVNQLKEMDAVEKLPQVCRELPKVRKELGQIPLVTPTSQIVGTQAVQNVLFDTPEERYKMITDQVKDICYGLYGKTSAPIDPELRKKALRGYAKGEEPITCRPAEVLKPELKKAQDEIQGLARDIDDVLLYALYPVTGKKFLSWKYKLEEPPAETRPRTLEQAKAEQDLIAKAKAGKLIEKVKPADPANLRKFSVVVDGQWFEVGVAEDGSRREARSAGAYLKQTQPSPVPARAEAARQPLQVPPEGILLKAPMPGMVVSVVSSEGDQVKKGETVFVLEAMKMENALAAPADGVVKQITVKSGDRVKKDDLLCVICS
ncbi:MAG: pyruvate carboxylase subunit B [Pseudomonadota bacterium]